MNNSVASDIKVKSEFPETMLKSSIFHKNFNKKNNLNYYNYIYNSQNLFVCV